MARWLLICAAVSGALFGLYVLVEWSYDRPIKYRSPRSAKFDLLAKAFRDKAGIYRVPEGESVQKRLPTCPETWSKDIGTGILVAHDYSRPSYRLTRGDAFALLGQPDGINGDHVRWELGTNASNHSELYVQFHDGYVVDSILTTSAVEAQK